MVGPVTNVPTSTSSLADSFAGALDHLAGSTDEAVGRAAATMRPGWTPTRENRGWADHAMGSVDEWVPTSPLDPVLDATFSGHVGDTVDLLGPEAGTGEVTDPIVRTPNEPTSLVEDVLRWMVANPVPTAAAAILLYVLPAVGDLAGLAETAAGDEGGESQ